MVDAPKQEIMGRKASEHKLDVELEFTAQSTPLDLGLPPGGLWSYFTLAGHPSYLVSCV